jgi:hypothetical protein
MFAYYELVRGFLIRMGRIRSVLLVAIALAIWRHPAWSGPIFLTGVIGFAVWVMYRKADPGQHVQERQEKKDGQDH